MLRLFFRCLVESNCRCDLRFNYTESPQNLKIILKPQLFFYIPGLLFVILFFLHRHQKVFWFFWKIKSFLWLNDKEEILGTRVFKKGDNLSFVKCRQIRPLNSTCLTGLGHSWSCRKKHLIDKVSHS